MTAITTTRFKESTDSLLRFAMRADAVLSGLAGIAVIPLAGRLAEISGTTKAFEYSMSAFLIAYGVVVLALADWMPLTTLGVVLTLATGVYTLVFAGLQYQGVRRMKA